MKKFFLALALAAFASVGSMFGATVQFNTNNTSLCTDGTGACTNQFVIFGGGTLRLTYNPITTGLLNADPIASPTFGSLLLECGDFTVNTAGAASNTSCASQPLPSNLNLYLRFTQVLPEPGSGQINSSSIVGTIGGNSGSATITWLTPSTTINTTNFSISYRVTNNPLNIVNPAGGGVTSIQGEVRDNMVPEPSTYAMLGSALLGLGLLRRRKA